MANKNDKKKPDNLIFEERLHNVRVSVWENQDKEGNVFHNVSVVRRYQSGPDEWSSSPTFTGLGDLALLREACELAIAVLRQKAIETPVRVRKETRAV